MILKLKYDPVRIFILKKLIFLSRSFFFLLSNLFFTHKKKKQIEKTSIQENDTSKTTNL